MRPAILREVRCGSSLRISGRKPSEVTAILGLLPSVEEEGLWIKEAPIVDATELAEPLTALLELLEPVGKQLEELRDAGCRIDFFCYLGSYDLEHCAILPRDLLRRLSAVGDLWLDVYCEDFPEGCS